MIHSSYLNGNSWNIKQGMDLFDDAISFFWRLIDINDEFFDYACGSEKILDIVVTLLYRCLLRRDDPTNNQYFRISAIILHHLSTNRKFAVQMNRPFASKLPYITGGAGCYADALVLVFNAIIFHKKSISRYTDSYLTIIDNISPYIKKFSILSSNKLLNMFKVFSNSRFLLANEFNHLFIFFLLETFNNVIQYQFSGNSYLIYEIVRNEDLFIHLRELRYDTMLESQKESGPDKENEMVFHNEHWFKQWYSQLPLQTVMCLLHALKPDIEILCQEKNWSDEKIVSHLQSSTTSLVGVLPVPHMIFVRKLHINQTLEEWISSYIWALIYLRQSIDSINLWAGTEIRRFIVQSAD